jgi:hypothetical protein
MIRKIASFKYAIFGLFSAALVSVACSDDDDAVFNGGAGSAGKTSGGAGSGGKATTAGSSSSGAAAGGTNGGTSAGSATAGTTSAGTGGTTAGSAGTATVGGEGGALSGGAGGEGGGLSGGAGGEGGVMSGGAGGEGGTPFVADVLDNPGFEANTGTTITGWTNEGSPGAAYVEYKDADAHSGHNKLSHWTMWSQGAPDYTARTYQTVAPIANGTYSFSIWLNRDWETTQYLYARGFNANDPSEEKTLNTTDVDGYTKVTLSGIQVTSGTCTIGIYTASPAGSYANFDDAELTLE